VIRRKRPGPPLSYDNSPLRKTQENEIARWLNPPPNSTRKRMPGNRTREPLNLPLRHKEVPGFVTDLSAGFDNKCPFCESTLDPDRTVVSFYRPPYRALQEQNDIPAEHHYCWLMWEWSNLYPACESCARSKGTLFPVARERINIGIYAEYALRREMPLLLDPCYDDPEAYLEFDEDGSVTAKSGSERGKQTIEILRLNRESLQANRKAEAIRLKQAWEEELQKASVPLAGVSEILQAANQALEAYCLDDQPFAGMKRQLLRRWSENFRSGGREGRNIVASPDIQNMFVSPKNDVTSQPGTDRSLLDHPQPVRDPYENAVFVSYAWGGESESIVDQLEQAFAQRGIRIVRDKEALEYKGSIETFEQRIGMGKGIVLVISDKYLRSEHCMYELVQLNKNLNLHSRIFPIVLADARIYTASDRFSYIKYWEEKIKELEDAIRQARTMTNLTGIHADLDKYWQIRNNFDELTDLLSDMNVLTPQLHAANDFSILITKVESWMGGKE
jgi:uncharacterized protein (TIGR02646 family)